MSSLPVVGRDLEEGWKSSARWGGALFILVTGTDSALSTSFDTDFPSVPSWHQGVRREHRMLRILWKMRGAAGM